MIDNIICDTSTKDNNTLGPRDVPLQHFHNSVNVIGILVTSPQSKLRRVRRKGPIGYTMGRPKFTPKTAPSPLTITTPI